MVFMKAKACLVNIIMVVLFSHRGVCDQDIPELDVHYFEQRVDHFGFHKRDTFRQRYLVYDKEFVEGGPIFFYCGGEMHIEIHAKQTVSIFHYYYYYYCSTLLFFPMLKI